LKQAKVFVLVFLAERKLIFERQWRMFAKTKDIETF